VEKDMEFVDCDPSEAWKFRKIIISKVSIVELIGKYNIQLEEKMAGEDFTHRTFCPFHAGKSGGRERTPSLFVSSKTNSFFCFACGTCGDVINFVSFIEGTPKLMALQKLAKDIGLINKDNQWDELQLDILNKNGYTYNQLKNINSYVLNISFLIRAYIKKFVGTNRLDVEFEWIDKICSEVDKQLMDMEYDDWEKAENLYNRICHVINNRINGA
jgi:signal peptidase I